MWGKPQSWRAYKCDRVEAGPTYVSWLHFTWSDTDPATLAIEEFSLGTFLAMGALRTTSSKAAKLNRLLLKFLCRADRDGFDDPVRSVFDAEPKLRAPLHALLPQFYDDNDVVFSTGMTVEKLAAS